MKPPTFFFGIRDRARLRWEQLEADPELSGPWVQLFRQVQSPRHVLSELLQNADDAGAQRVNAQIEDDLFIFEHDGADFSEDDFASLCKFGFSNKRNLLTIGFRGIGFKSTFSLGDPVEVWTPTLHVLFRKERFTLPEWIDNPESVSSTMIGVKIEEQDRAKELQKNLDEWAASPASLLFFRNIQELRIGDNVVRKEEQDSGPVFGMQRVELTGETASQVILFRAVAEEFPAEAIDEIRQERMTHDFDLPPCHVEIVLGLHGSQRLYSVLPTTVQVELPFSCNAPFVQDPARMAIKEPSISPTNRWLLRRLGKTAAAAMLGWMKTAELPLDQRAEAYRLLLPATKFQGDMGSDCAALIKAGFVEAIRANGGAKLLTSNGDLAPPRSCLAVPAPLYDVWTSETLVSIFGSSEQHHVLAAEVPNEARRRLVDWSCLDLLSEQDAIKRLTSDANGHDKPPRPQDWTQLLALWRFVFGAIKSDYDNSQRRSLMMIPVEGDLELHPAAQVVRVSSRPVAMRDEDWAFVSDLLLVVDREWLEFLKATMSSAVDADPARSKQSEWLKEALRVLGLDGVTPMDKVVAQANRRYVARKDPWLPELVRLAHISAFLDVQVSTDFPYVTKGMELSMAANGIVSSIAGSIDELVPEPWAQSHLLHDDYAGGSDTCSAEQWSRWASSEKSRLYRFAHVTSKVTKFSNPQDFQKFLRPRVKNVPTKYEYQSGRFEIEDSDFDPALTRHWEQLEALCPEVWVRVLRLILEDGHKSWLNYSCAQAREVSGREDQYKKPVDCGAFPAAWLKRFADTACVPDTYGRPRHPAEMLMRSPDTEPLLGVESFVKAEWDTEATKPLLKLLGARDTPTGADKLVDRIRVLASIVEPPIHEVGKWYDALDHIVARLRPEDQSQLRQTFRSERLILTADEDWATSDAVFQCPDEQGLPDATVIHDSFAQLPMWGKLGVAERPTFDLILEWFNGLKADEELTDTDLKRVRGYLHRFPAQIWLECGHWLAMDSSWVSNDQLDFALTKRMPVAFDGLFPRVRARTADLRMVLPETAEEPPFSSVRRLGAELDYRLTEVEERLPGSGDHSWIEVLGRCLQRVKLVDDEQTSCVRALAVRLARVKWQPVGSLRVTPYLHGEPAGQPSSPRVLWHEDSLYVPSSPFEEFFDDLVAELGRRFILPEVADAIRSCAERPEGFVIHYVRSKFQLDMEAAPGQNSAPPGHAGQTLESTTTAADAPGRSSLGPPAPDSGNLTDNATSAVLPAAVDDSSDEKGSTAAQAATTTPTPREPPRPGKPPLIDLYAFERGFRGDASRSVYIHADGRVLRRAEPPFTWELYSQQGERLRAFWVSDQSLASSGVEIACETWECIKRAPEASSMIFTDGADVVCELTGTELAGMLEREELKIFPAKYRLRLMSST